MKIANSLKIGVVLVFVAAAAGLFLFARMYRNDVKALKAFIAAYERFDQAMPADAGRGGPEGLGPAGEALAGLQARASMRISSLIRNDGLLMDEARKIASLADQELESFKTPGAAEASQRADLGRLTDRLREERRAAFARFQDLAPTSHRGPKS